MYDFFIFIFESVEALLILGLVLSLMEALKIKAN
jgi:hypothetical protein